MMSLIVCIFLLLNHFVNSENSNRASIETVVNGIDFVEVAQRLSDSNSSVKCAKQVSYLLNYEQNAIFQSKYF